MSAKYIIRLDDASEYMSYSKWEPFFALFDKYKIFPIIGVIPDIKDPEIVKNVKNPMFWDKVKIWESNNYVIGLHGYNHLYSNKNSGILNLNNYSEFAGVSYERQVEMIRKGVEVFNVRGISTKLFIAPAHSFDKNTIKALNLLNIEYISDGFFINPILRWGIKWIPQQLWSPKQKKRGTWTICIHPETANQNTIYNLEKFIKKNNEKFIHPYSVEFKENFNISESIFNLSIAGKLKLIKIKNLFFNSLFKFRNKLSYLPKKVQIICDQTQGLDFLVPVQPEDVGFDSKVVYRSSPSGNKFLKKIFNDLKIDRNDSILDIGCGKGSAMRIMHEYPFKRIDGIEISDNIAKTAIKNFQILKSKKTNIYVLDAAHFHNYEMYNYIYLYNPFPEDVMKLVWEQILKSLENLKRELIIIYNNPTCSEIILNSNIFQKVKTYPDEWGNGITIFSNLNYHNSKLSSYR